MGKRFIQEVRNKVLLIRKNPKIYSVRYDAVQTAVLDVFPFMIHYTVDNQKKTVIIVAVFHTSPQLMEKEKIKPNSKDL